MTERYSQQSLLTKQALITHQIKQRYGSTTARAKGYPNNHTRENTNSK
jgi:hypothetical protein